MSTVSEPVSLADLRAAHPRIRDKIDRPPVLTSGPLDAPDFPAPAKRIRFGLPPGGRLETP